MQEETAKSLRRKVRKSQFLPLRLGAFAVQFHRLTLFLVALAVSFSLISPELPFAKTYSDKRIIAVGDVHGAYDAFVQILQKAGLLDAKKNWNAGNATLIQTGDVLDRGPKSRAAMDLLMRLEEQASAKKGRVFALLGNHEVMNMIGDLRYVSAEEYASYANGDSEKRRARCYVQYQELLKKRAQTLGQEEPIFTTVSKSEWESTHPMGFVEQREAFSPEGKYGRWLRKHSAVMEMDDIIFLHGGISLNVSKLKIKEINRLVAEDLKRFDQQKKYLIQNKLILPFFTLEEMLAAARNEVDFITSPPKGKEGYQDSVPKNHLQTLEAFLALGSWFSTHPEGPLWFRGYSEWPEEEGDKNITDMLNSYGVAHFVVGHTVQPNGSIQSRFNGKVFLIDTGMLASTYPTGRASALEIQNGSFTAIYMDNKVVLWNKTQ